MHRLRESGIVSGQGFLFSQAVPEEDFIQLFRSDLAVGSSQAYMSRKA